jgi:LPXTG-motif cell wall-anchored protein
VPTAVPDAPNGMGGTSVIAGSVGGVTAFLLLLFVIIYFWKRRKKKAVEDDLSSNIGQSGKYFLFLFYLD